MILKNLERWMIHIEGKLLDSNLVLSLIPCEILLSILTALDTEINVIY